MYRLTQDKTCFQCNLQMNKCEIPEERLSGIGAETDENGCLAVVSVFNGYVADKTGIRGEARSETAELVCG